jgi:hypothetical protein
MAAGINARRRRAIADILEVIRAFRQVPDPAGLGNLLFEVEKAISGETTKEPLTEGGGKLYVFRLLLAAFRNGRIERRKDGGE